MNGTFILNTDGGSRGNPGNAACAAVIKTERGEVVKTKGKALGICTNNEAEYMGLILGLETCIEMQIKYLKCFCDSELIVHQVNGKYKTSNPNMAKLCTQVRNLSTKFDNVTFTPVPRNLNAAADKIVNDVLDNKYTE